MPRVKGQKEGRSTWFTQFYRADPGNLKTDNAKVRKLWEDAHPGEEWTPKHAQSMANVKSNEKKRRRKGGRPRKDAAAVAVGDATPRTPRTYAGAANLAALEDTIDDCLTAAHMLAHKDEEMDQVVKHLRMARNTLILIQGKPK